MHYLRGRPKATESCVRRTMRETAAFEYLIYVRPLTREEREKFPHFFAPTWGVFDCNATPLGYAYNRTEVLRKSGAQWPGRVRSVH